MLNRPSSASVKQQALLPLKTAKIGFSVAPYGEPSSSRTPPPPPPSSSRVEPATSCPIKHDLSKIKVTKRFSQQENVVDVDDETQKQNNTTTTTIHDVAISFLSPIRQNKNSADDFEKEGDHLLHHQQQQETLLYLKNVIKNSIDTATKISLQRDLSSIDAEMIMTTQQQEQTTMKYDRAKQEAAVASIAVLEGLVDLLRQHINNGISGKNNTKRRASSTISSFRGLSSTSSKNTNNNNNNDEPLDSSSSMNFLTSFADTLQDSIFGLKAIILPTVASNTNNKNQNISSSSSSSFFERRFNISLQQNLISDHKLVNNLIESTKQRLKTYHRSLFLTATIRNDTTTISQDSTTTNILTPEMASRIKNCDRMLELLRNKKKNKRKIVNENDDVSSSSTSAIIASTNPWADAEDALHVLRLRFVFHLWKIFSKCERQRRMNSFRFTQKLAKERANVKMLHTFLSFKRSQTQSSVLAAKNLVKENQHLLKKVAECEEKLQRANQQVERVNILYRNSLAENEELRDQIEETERTPMILDFRQPIRDSVSGIVIEEGILEFRKTTSSTTTLNNKLNNKLKIQNQNSSSLSSYHYYYPPFVDWNCPRQNAHARALLQNDTIERLSDKKGIGIPGYQQPSSFYEIRTTMNITNHNLDHSNSSFLLLKEILTSDFSSKRWNLEFVAFVNGILRNVLFIQENNNNNKYSSNEILIDSFNRARQKRNNNHHHDVDDKDEGDHDYEHSEQRQQIEDEQVWDINEPFAAQIIHREFFGIVIPSFVASNLMMNKSSNDNNTVVASSKTPAMIDFSNVGGGVHDDENFVAELESDVDDDEEEDEEETDQDDDDAERSASSPQQPKEDTTKNQGGNSFGSFLFSSSRNDPQQKKSIKLASTNSNQNNFVTISKKKPKQNIRQKQEPESAPIDRKKDTSSSSPPQASFRIAPTKSFVVANKKSSALDLIIESIIDSSLKKLKEALSTRVRKTSEETETFVRTSTEKILQMNKNREEKRERDRNDLVKKQEFSSSSNMKSKNDFSTSNFSPVAPPHPHDDVSTSFCEISSLSELITNSEITFQLFTIIFGKLAIVEVLQNYFRTNVEEANQLHVFIVQHQNQQSMLVRKNSSGNFNASTTTSSFSSSFVFNKFMAILVSGSDKLLFVNGGNDDLLREAFSGNHHESRDENDDLVSLGRNLCVSIQHHLILSMSEEEKQCKKIESNSLMLRRLLKASSWKKIK